MASRHWLASFISGLELRYTDPRCGLAKLLVQGCQGQALADRQFQIGRVIFTMTARGQQTPAHPVTRGAGHALHRWFPLQAHSPSSCSAERSLRSDTEATETGRTTEPDG